MPSRPDPALRLPSDPRQAGRDVIAEGWACRIPASHGKLCGLPKPPHAAHCGRPGCGAAYALRLEIGAAHEEAIREDRERRRAQREAVAKAPLPAVVSFEARR